MLVAFLVVFGSLLGASAQTLTVTDADVLNFALQAECLAAAFWTAAATGESLTAAQLGSTLFLFASALFAYNRDKLGYRVATFFAGGGGPIIGGQKAILQGSALQLAIEFSSEEQAHLAFLRNALGSAALPCPEIDIGYSFNSFVNLTLAALQNFNPYAPFSAYEDFLSLYFAGFILADPEVFAYNGAATLISNKTYLESAAGILAVEGYHAGAIRENLATVSSYSLGTKHLCSCSCYWR